MAISAVRLGPLRSEADLRVGEVELARKSNELVGAVNDLLGATVSWDQIEGKPLVFPPDTSLLPASTGGSAASVTWATLSGKPSTFPPSGHRTPWTTIDGIPQIIVEGDPRLSDVRAPLLHASTHYVGGTDPLVLASLSGNLPWSRVSGTPTTIGGYGITDGVLTTDPRLNNARTPSLHAPTHTLGGSDPVSLDATQIVSGFLADARIPAGIARYAGTSPYTGMVFTNSAAGAYLGTTSGTTGAIRVVSSPVLGSPFGWFIYTSDGDGSLFFSDDTESVLLELRVDGTFTGITTLDAGNVMAGSYRFDSSTAGLEWLNSSTRVIGGGVTIPLASVTGTVGVAKGGTGLVTAALGSMLYASAANVYSSLAPNTLAAKRFLRQTGTGSAFSSMAWDTIATTDLTGSIAYAQLPTGSGTWANGVAAVTTLSGGLATTNVLSAGTLLSVGWATGSFGGATGSAISIKTATAAPTTNPSGGYVLFVDPTDNKYKARGPSGTITLIANP